MEWSAIESAYAIKPDDRTRDQVLSEQASERSLNESSANFISDVSADLQVVFTYSKTPGEFASSLFSVLTKGDRGIIFGTLMIIISLSMLTLQDSTKDQM
tara:strand:- start:1575 stop:1874 length:300 start_codon:yes stop_codon:yes gene_type:complete